MSLRLSTRGITVLLGSSVGRRRLMNLLDERTSACADGHGIVARRLHARVDEPATQRLATLSAACVGDAQVVLVDRFTDGLDAAERRELLTRLRQAARGGVTVLVDDIDPVAALAVADTALRVAADGSPLPEEPALYLAS